MTRNDVLKYSRSYPSVEGGVTGFIAISNFCQSAQLKSFRSALLGAWFLTEYSPSWHVTSKTVSEDPKGLFNVSQVI